MKLNPERQLEPNQTLTLWTQLRDRPSCVTRKKPKQNKSAQRWPLEPQMELCDRANRKAANRIKVTNIIDCSDQ